MCQNFMTLPKNRVSCNKNNRKGSELQFPGKLHDMMTYVEQNSMESSTVSWTPDGRGIIIRNPEKLTELLPLFFSQTKYRSFRRQLNMWHFERVLEGPNKGAFIHPYFVRGNKALTARMSRHLLEMPEFNSLLKEESKSGISKNISVKKPLPSPKEMMITSGGQSLGSMLFGNNNNNNFTSAWLQEKLSNTVPFAALSTSAFNIANDDSNKQRAFSMEDNLSCRDGDLVSFAGRSFYFTEDVRIEADLC